MTETEIYRGDRLSYGNVVDGPAIVEEKITTIVIPPVLKQPSQNSATMLLKRHLICRPFH